MQPHQLAAYKDGFVMVPYCRVCGQEGQALMVDCPGKVVSSNAVDKNKSIDKKEEPL